MENIKSHKAMAITIQSPEYYHDVSGYLAKPMRPGSYPGIVMIHEWWGLNNYIKMTAEELAEEGYVVLAVDLFQGDVTNDPNRAMKLARSVKQEQASNNLRSAVQYLRQKENVSKIASLGWCFGGAQSLKLALSGEQLNATVIYYGNLTSDKKELARIHWPVLGIFGAEDEVVLEKEVNLFKKTLKELKIPNDIYIYPGVGHAFANPSNPDYGAKETIDAWNKMLGFLEKNLK